MLNNLRNVAIISPSFSLSDCDKFWAKIDRNYLGVNSLDEIATKGLDE